ncbi:MAG: hypothetical protein IPK15_20950 [Verrucomicrobia bacterium]|nr:hypothetical protein [Verrucomicrobiota bacterium]
MATYRPDVFEVFIRKTLRSVRWCAAGRGRALHARFVRRHLAVPILRHAREQLLITSGDLREIGRRGGEHFRDMFVERLRLVVIRGELRGQLAALRGELRIGQRGECGP